MPKKSSKQSIQDPSLHEELRERTVGYIAASFALVAGLAWNDAIQELIRELFPIHLSSIYIKFLYAVLITLVVVFVTVYLNKLFTKGK